VTDVRVRGNATAEELAAVLAVVSRVEGAPAEADRLAQWRRDRRAALAREPSRS
jgi:Acyl-CoA carboxylase epsilon subunit